MNDKLRVFLGVVVLMFIGYWYNQFSCRDWQERGFFDQRDCVEHERDERDNRPIRM